MSVERGVLRWRPGLGRAGGGLGVLSFILARCPFGSCGRLPEGGPGLSALPWGPGPCRGA